jgi:hypothetical protein
MNEAAIGDKQLAISENRVRQAHLPLSIQPVSLIANCSSLIAAFPSAISFTVTAAVTSVTHRRLAEGVLITVGKVYSDQEPEALGTAKHGGLALLHCSFGEATCIQ